MRIPLTTKPGEVTGWAAYVAGVVWALRAGRASGARRDDGDLQRGRRWARGCRRRRRWNARRWAPCVRAIDRMDQARMAQRAENEYVGAPTGLLDQISSLFGSAATALLIDFRELTVSAGRLRPVVVRCRVAADRLAGAARSRRRRIRRAAAFRASGRPRTWAWCRCGRSHEISALDRVTDSVDARRARHVLTENQRVFDFVAALGDSDYIEAGRIFTASHASMRDDFAITTPHIDLIARHRGGRGRAGRPDDRRRIRRLRDRIGAG